MTKTFYYTTMESPVGVLRLVSCGGSLVSLSMDNMDKGYADAEKRPDYLAEAVNQLKEYFNGKRQSFSLPLAPEGTEFQKQVWKELCNIPYGETISYKTLATRAGNVNASRAVGMANNRNPIGIIIPCHRVIGANGSLTGYAGGLDRKEWLLNHELLYTKKSNAA